MAEILNLPSDFFQSNPNPASIQACLQQIYAQIRQLDAEEPEDMESDAYMLWGDRHEELEDLADELCDLLDDLTET